MNQTRVLRNTVSTLSVTFYVDGTATDPTGNTATVTITREDGTAFATNAATTRTGTGVYTYSLAAQTALDNLKLVWTGTFAGASQSVTTYCEVVGGHLFTEAEARAFKVGGTAVLSDATLYPDTTIAEGRDAVTQLLEDSTGVSWIERYHRERIDGEGFSEIRLSKHRVNTVQAVTIDGTAKTVGDFDADPITGFLRFTTGYFTRPTMTRPRNVTVKYEHGYQRSEHGVGRIALTILANTLVNGNESDRAQFETTEFSTVRYAPFAPTGIPVVDKWIKDHDERLPV